MSNAKADLLLQYQSIMNKLRKKRLLKKPNVAEAVQQFEQLGVSFEREGLPHYAGLSYQAAAKCQNSLGNTLEEGYLLLNSCRQFMSAYINNLNAGYIPNDSFLNHSFMNYRECIKRLENNKNLSSLVADAVTASVVIEMADNLSIKANFMEEGCQEYEKALKYVSKFPAEKIYCLQKILSLKIELGEYTESLDIVNKIVEEGNILPESGHREDVLRSAEIIRIFLLLILRPTPQQISTSGASALEKYAWVETSSSNEGKDLQTKLKAEGLSMLGEDLFLKLQSLVMACQYCDTDCLELLEIDLIPCLNNEQRTLLHVLIKENKN